MNDTILQRVRKMMTLANDDAATEGERDNAIRMAHELLAKHNLSMAEAMASGQKPTEKRVDDKTVSISRPWARRMAMAVADLYFCKYFFCQHADFYHCSHYFIGLQSNVTTAKEMFTYLVESVQREGRASAKLNGGSRKESYWNAFCRGASDRIYVRCAQLRRDAEQKSQPVKTSGTALVLASMYQLEDAANSSYLNDVLGVKLHTRRAKERATVQGYHEGSEYGSGVGLHRQVANSNRHCPVLTSN